MTRHEYYEDLKGLARRTRASHGLSTPRVMRSDMRRIYKHHGIQIDLWPLPEGVRGAYFNDEFGVSVAIARYLPDDPAIFTMAHELKHHLVDRESGVSYCSSKNQKEPIEIGAEVFAAELIFPEEDFMEAMRVVGVPLGGCTPEHVVTVKENTRTTLSHQGITKRAVRLGFAIRGAFDHVTSWAEVRDGVFGTPAWRRGYRRRKRG